MPPFSLKNATRTQISIRSSITIHFSPVLHRPHTVLTHSAKIIRKEVLYGHMFISHFKSLSGKTRHQQLLTHDREGSFTTEMGKRLPQRSPAPLAMPLASVLVTICLLLEMVQNAITPHKSDSLVGGNSKRMTLTPLSSSCVGPDSRRVISPSLTTPNFSVRQRMMSSPPSKAASSGVTSAPFSHCTAPWRSSSSPTPSSSCPAPQSTSSPPDIWLPVPNHHFQTRKKTPPCGRVFSFSEC